MRLVDGLLWRYEVRVRPYLLLDESVAGFLLRRIRNLRRARRPQPLVYVFADCTNAGDRASSLGIQQLTRRPGIELFCSPVALPETTGVLKNLARWRPKSSIIVGGGGLLQKTFEDFWRFVIAQPLPFALFGVGVNELEGSRTLPPDALLAEIVRRSAFTQVRDTRTQTLLQQFTDREIRLGICPSVHAVREIAQRCTLSTPETLLHVVHPVDLELSGVPVSALHHALTELAREMHLRYDTSTHIREELPRLVQRYLQATVVVTSRLHGAIFAYALAKPLVALASDRKMHQFIETFAPDTPLLPPTADKALLRDAVGLAIQTRAASAVRHDAVQQLQANQAAMDEAFTALAQAGASRPLLESRGPY